MRMHARMYANCNQMQPLRVTCRLILRDSVDQLPDGEPIDSYLHSSTTALGEKYLGVSKTRMNAGKDSQMIDFPPTSHETHMAKLSPSSLSITPFPNLARIRKVLIDATWPMRSNLLVLSLSLPPTSSPEDQGLRAGD